MRGVMRAFACEFELVKSSVAQLGASLLLVSAIIALSTGSVATLAATLVVTLSFSVTMLCASTDDVAGWPSARLLGGVSRRDVVLGRYAFLFVVAVAAAVVALLVSLALQASGVFGDREGVAATLAACALALGICAVFACVAVPCTLKWGMRGAMRYLPLALCALVLVPIGLVLWRFGADPAALDHVVEWAAAPAHQALLAGILLATCAALTLVSVYVSLRIYTRKDL